MQKFKGGIRNSSENLYTEAYYKSIGYKLKENAQVKEERWNGFDYEPLYDLKDIMPINSEKERAIKEKHKHNKGTTCNECGKKTITKTYAINGKHYCETCTKEHKESKKRYLEKYLKEMDISFVMKNIHRNKKLHEELEQNRDAVLKRWLENNAVTFSMGIPDSENKYPVRIHVAGEVIGLFPEKILLKEYKNMPNIYLTTKKMFELLKKKNLKAKAYISGYKYKETYQGRSKHLLKISLYL